MKKYHLEEKCRQKYRHPDISNQNLAAHYKLWAGLTSPDTVFDYSLNGFLGTIGGAAVPAYPGFSFDDNDGYIYIGSGPTSVKTISIWLKQDDIAGEEYPIALNGTDYIYIASGVVTVHGLAGHTLYVNGVAGTSGVTAIAANTWVHIAVTDSTANNASNLNIGVAEDDYLKGIIGEVRLYSAVLTLQEIKNLYALTKWRYK